MADVFELKNYRHRFFRWDHLGDIKAGRGSLGEEMPVLIYRLMQYTMLDVLSRELGAQATDDIFRRSGHLAGGEFAKNALNLEQEFGAFVAQLQSTLAAMRIGILRMEEYEAETGRLVLTVAEDLDCSGLLITNETVCTYDEGFIAGILDAYSGKKYEVREIDCWASGNRVCRFEGTVKE